MSYRFIARFKAATGIISHFDIPEAALAFDSLTPYHPSASVKFCKAAVAKYPEFKGSAPIQAYRCGSVRIYGQPGLIDGGTYDALYFKVPISENNSDAIIPKSLGSKDAAKQFGPEYSARSCALQFEGDPRSARYFGLAYFLVLCGACGITSSFLVSNKLPKTRKIPQCPLSPRELMLSSSSLRKLMDALVRPMRLSVPQAVEGSSRVAEPSQVAMHATINAPGALELLYGTPIPLVAPGSGAS